MSARYLSLFTLIFFASPALAQREFGFDNRKPTGQAYLSPEETAARMQVPAEFELNLFAGEPTLVNPIACTVDERGRVWVVESFEYPSKTPPGKMPRDRIKILEDTDGDGKCDKSTVFAEGKDFPKTFDLASAIEVGHGGVFVGAAPYLWFLKDTNGDDKADSFEILLSGFGAQDTHEMLNTLQWGPDGRLYGLHGIFTESKVEGVQMNAAVWAYDYPRRTLERVSEGTSNPWGMDYNAAGDRILACCVIPHLFHVVPGGIYKRQASSTDHPHAYGYIDEICDHTFHRESGWAHAGLVSLDTPLMPERFRQSVVFGSIHGSSFKQNVLTRNGATYRATKGEDFLRSGDRNFRPVNVRWGAGGDLYVIDWHDQHPCHQTPADAWDYDRGRVYRIHLKGTPNARPGDLSKKSDAELVALLGGPDRYLDRTAARLLAQKKTLDAAGRVALDARLARYDLPAVWLKLARRELSPADREWLARGIADAKLPTPVRAWLVRSLAEAGLDNAALVAAQKPLTAGGSFPPEVRAEWLILSRTRPVDADSLALTRAALGTAADEGDRLLPQLSWLALERFVIPTGATAPGGADTGADFASDDPFFRTHLTPRVVRRMAASDRPGDLARAMALLMTLDGDTLRHSLEGFALALDGRKVVAPAAEWDALRAKLAKSNDAAIKRLAERVAIAVQDRGSLKAIAARVGDAKRPAGERIDGLRNLARAADPATLPAVLAVATGENVPDDVRAEALRALAAFDGPDVAARVLARFPRLAPPLQAEAVQLLCVRAPWAAELLKAVEAGTVPRTTIGDNAALRIRAFNKSDLSAALDKVWGRYRSTPAELNAAIDRMRASLDAPASFTRGKKAFETHCSKCHQFDGVGHEVGPRLDGAARDIEYLLGNVMDPNRVIGAPYYVRVVELMDGRVETGLLVEDTAQHIRIKVENAVVKTFPKTEVESITVVEKSVMPEGLTQGMTPGDFRDLLRYVMVHPFVPGFTARGTATPAAMTGKWTLSEGVRANDPVELTAEVESPVEMRTRLLIGANAAVTVSGVTASPVRLEASAKAAPDTHAVDVTLKPGVNVVRLRLVPTGPGVEVFARFLDADRKLRYRE